MIHTLFLSRVSRSFTFLLSVLLLLGIACSEQHQKEYVDLSQIMERDTLKAVTISSSSSYFLYRGEPMGFQYDLARQFADSLGLELQMLQAVNEDEAVRMLLDGKADLIAYNLTMSNERMDSITYCGKENINHQVLVQRISKHPLRDVAELIGKEVYVTPGKYYNRMSHLNDEMGGGIHIHKVEADTTSTESLIAQVAHGKIDYTVANNQEAILNRSYYPNLDIKMAVSFDQRSSWAVRTTSPQLAAVADKWHRANIESPETKAAIKRYFESTRRVHRGTILSVEEGKISHYDAFFRLYAKEIGWDWRLLAALAYTESNFNPDIVSWAGARGLMQLMPNTARAMGMPEGMYNDPEESIKAGVKYIAALQKMFRKVEDPVERHKFVLAAYNAGAGHVYDAMALAEKYGRNPHIWEHNVDHYILLKSNEEYYLDPVCKNGYFRGIETYNFVRTVEDRAEMYKKRIKK